MATPNFDITTLVVCQTQKETTINDGYFEIDDLTTGSEAVANSPSITTNGTVYLIGSAGSGDFAGQNNNLAIRINGGWVFVAPKEGLTFLNKATTSIYRKSATTWVELGIPPTSIDDLSDVDTTTAAPSVGDRLDWDGSNWVPTAPDIDPAFSASVQTTDATVTDIVAVAMASSSTHTFTVEGHGYEDATGDTLHFWVRGGARNEAGTSTAGIAIVEKVSNGGSSTAWDITVDADDTGDTWRIRATGEAAHTIDWTLRYRNIVTTGA